MLVNLWGLGFGGRTMLQLRAAICGKCALLWDVYPILLMRKTASPFDSRVVALSAVCTARSSSLQFPNLNRQCSMDAIRPI